MAKQGKDHNARIWRTVVFAGAMLGAPTLAAAGDPTPAKAPAQPAPSKPAPPPAEDTGFPKGPFGTGSLGSGSTGTIGSGHSDPVKNKQMQIDRADSERKTLLGMLATASSSEIDQVRRNIAAKDLQIKKLVDEMVALRKPRPRTLSGTGGGKPVGRGFVLS